jgi:hypothetical protein
LRDKVVFSVILTIIKGKIKQLIQWLIIFQARLLINSDGDDSASDTREMHDVFIGPKAMSFYSGNEHGTDIFKNPDHRKALIKQLADFVSAGF